MTASIIYPKGSPRIAFDGKHVYMYEEPSNPKTKVWSVYNKQNEFLGQIRWKATWRMYALFSEKSEYGGSCFLEIGNFCLEQTRLHKKMQRELREE